MKGRLIYLIRTFFVAVLVFVIAKVVFMLANREGHSFMASDVWDVIRHGITLDFSTALYILAVPLLMVIATVWVKGTKARKVMKWMMRVYLVIMSLALSMAFVADTSLYPFWGFKLDASCLQYLETPTEAMASVSAGYLVLRFLLFCVIAYLLYRMFPDLPEQEGEKAASTPSPLKGRLLETVLHVCLIPLMIIGIRGGLDESTTNVGQVYFSQDQFLNHSAVNPVFSFISSFEKTANVIVDYDYYGEQELQQIMEGLYPVTSIGTDTLLTTTRPDIVIVLMESAGDLFSGVMPNLEKLKKEGINFTNCYGNSWRTDRGTVCTYSGYPSFPTLSVMKMPRKTRLLPGIASALRAEGYQTSYLYGGDINFTNMRSYLVATGWEQLTWKADYSGEQQRTAQWGVRDDITFNTLYDQITAADTTRHHLYGYSTLSSHEPWDVPVKKVSDEVENAFWYLDQCIGDFISKLKRTPQWKNLLVIFLPDHSISHGRYDERVQARNKIPMVWVGGAVRAPRQIDCLCNQTDLAATLLAQLQIPHDAFRWSRDVLSQSYVYPFAVHNFNNGFSVADSSGFMVYDLDAKRYMTNESRDAKRLERMGKAILQATAEDLKNK